MRRETGKVATPVLSELNLRCPWKSRQINFGIKHKMIWWQYRNIDVDDLGQEGRDWKVRFEGNGSESLRPLGFGSIV